MSLAGAVREEFERRYGGAASLLVRAPGRVNLIGEHTDYNDGFVLPMAIDRWLWAAVRPRDDGRVRVASLDLDEAGEFALAPGPARGRGWLEYVKGVAWSLGEMGHALRGFDAVVAGDVPLGAGLSSSAALELAAARAFAAASELPWSAAAMARAARRAENEWVGVGCGMMDQLASACGRAGHALLIDCRSLAIEPVPLPPETAVVVLDTGTRRRLEDSAYNERRAQCHAAAAGCGAAALRDVDAARLEAARATIDPVSWRRARHVLSENERTLLAAEAMRRGDASTLGRLMNDSQMSLRDDFEASTPALEAMTAAATASAGCLGARLTGAGFGGCVVALVREESRLAFTAEVAARYHAASGLVAGVHACRAVDGAERLPC